MCCTVTIQVAEALDQFVLDMEGWKQLRENELPLLVLWIDATLERYRSAVVRDLHGTTSLSREAPTWFSTSNPEVHSLLLAALGERSTDGERAWPVSPRRTAEEYETNSNSNRRPSGPVERKIPADVIDSIPTRDGKEVCLHYLSKRGCRSQDPERCSFKKSRPLRSVLTPAKTAQMYCDAARWHRENS